MSGSILQKEQSNSNPKKVVVSKKVKSHAKDPFFISKTKAAEAFLNKHGLPAVFTK
jgi:hypothetical protein